MKKTLKKILTSTTLFIILLLFGIVTVFAQSNDVNFIISTTKDEAQNLSSELNNKGYNVYLDKNHNIRAEFKIPPVQANAIPNTSSASITTENNPNFFQSKYFNDYLGYGLLFTIVILVLLIVVKRLKQKEEKYDEYYYADDYEPVYYQNPQPSMAGHNNGINLSQRLTNMQTLPPFYGTFYTHQPQSISEERNVDYSPYKDNDSYNIIRQRPMN